MELRTVPESPISRTSRLNGGIINKGSTSRRSIVRSLPGNFDPMKNHEDDELNQRMQSLRLANGVPKLTIDFIVVGGGIAGLASAYALAKSGHRVQVLERSDGLNQCAGGIRVPPNLTKILLEWGLHDLVQNALVCHKSRFCSLDTGEVIGALEWQDDIMREAGAEFLLMHHHDLHKALYNLAVYAGASITFNASCREVLFDEEQQRPIVILENGSRIPAEVVIGADGYRSVVRKIVAPEVDAGIDTGHSFYTITVPASEMAKDPELAGFVSKPEWPIWMGDMRDAFGYPIRGGKEYNFHVYWPDGELQDCGSEEEGWDVSVPASVINFGGYDIRLQRLFNLSKTAQRTRFIQREIAEDWLDESGRILLIGEAAHPLIPCSMQGPGLAVEDAAVLGMLMSHLSTREQIPQLLEAFQDGRQDRCVFVQKSELGNTALVTLPPSQGREIRDAEMRQSIRASDIAWDDSRLRKQWEEFGEVFGYDAVDAAEEWWSKWGALGAAADYLDHTPLEQVFQMTEVAITEF